MLADKEIAANKILQQNIIQCFGCMCVYFLNTYCVVLDFLAKKKKKEKVQ
jgi:hypothetical protein